MAGKDGSLIFDTKLDSSGFEKGLNGIGSVAQKGLAVTGKVLETAAAGIAALGGAAVKVGSDFEAGMSQVQAIMGTVSDQDLPDIIKKADEMGLSFEKGASATETAMNILTAKAMEMGASTKFSATESAEALNYMAMAGWKAEDMIGGIEGIMNLAAASGEDLAATSDIVTDALTAFGMKADESGHFADVLAQASASANTNVGEMGEAFKYVAPVAGTLGYSIEDVSMAIGLMSNGSVHASQAGTALRGALTRLVKPTEDMQQTMIDLGLAVEQVEHVVDSSKVDKLQGKIADKTAAMQKAQINYNTAVSKYGADSAQAQKAAISLETAQRKLAEASGSLSAAQAGSNQVVGIQNTLLTDGSGKMKSFYDVMLQLRKSFRGMTEEQQAQAAATLFGQEAMSGMLNIINASDEDFEKLSGALSNCSGASKEMAEIMQDNLQGQLTGLQSKLETLGISLYQTMQDTAKDVVKEAQGMVVQLQDSFNEGGFDGLVGSIGNVLAQVVQRTAQAAPMVIDSAVRLVTSFCAGLKNAPGIGEAGAALITSIIVGLVSCTGELWSTAVFLFAEFLSGLAAQLPQILESGKEAVAQFGQALMDNAPSIFSSAGIIISTLFNGIMSALPQISSAGVDILNRLAEGIAVNLPALIPTAMQALVEFSGSLRQNVGLLVDAGLNLVMTLAQSLIDNLPVFIETIPAIVTNIAGIINDNAPKLLTTGIELLGKLAMGLIQSIPVLVANIPQIIEAIVAAFTAFNWLSLGKNIVDSIAKGIKSLAKSVPGALKNIGQTAVNWLRTINWHTLGADIIDLILIGINSLLTAVPNALKSIGLSAVEFFKGIDWLDLGINVVKGIAAGITGALDGLWSAVGGLCSGMLDGIKDFFGIHSPSTVMTEQGAFLVQGLINGIADMPAELAAYLDQTVRKVIAWGQQMFSSVQSIIQNVVNTAVNLIATLPGKVWTWLVNVVTKVVQWGQQMYTTATTAIQRMISSIISLLSELPGKVWTWLVNTVAKVTAWGQQMLSTARDAVRSMVSNVISILSELPGKVSGELAKVTSGMVSWGADIVGRLTHVGSNIVSGIWNGISSGWNWLKDKVAGLANSLLDAAKNELGINSPSTEFRDQFGRWLMPGAVEGVKRSMPGALREMKAQAGELLAAMQGTVDASINRVALNASAMAGARALTSAGTVIYNDNHQEQENNYHVPVVTPAETAKANREAFRRMAGGVK